MQDRKCLTYTGKVIDIFNMKPTDFCLEDIAHSLAVKTRFNGAAKVPYSIAQHCCLAAIWAQEPLDKRIALLHDAEEAYLPDWPGPWKKDEPFKTADNVGTVLRYKIWDKYVCNYNVNMVDYKRIDRQLLIAEIRVLVHNWNVLSFANAFLELPIKIEPIWSWQEAEREFLDMCQILGIKD